MSNDRHARTHTDIHTDTHHKQIAIMLSYHEIDIMSNDRHARTHTDTHTDTHTRTRTTHTHTHTHVAAKETPVAQPGGCAKHITAFG